MIENVLSDIGGIGIYGVISIVIFVTVFIVAVAWMVRLKPPYLRAMEQLPLQDDAPSMSVADRNLNPHDP